jgi:hypothetical protein
MLFNRLSDLVRLRTFADTQVQPVSRANMGVLSELMPGDTVRAQIEAALPEGTFRVAIRNQPFILRLPFKAQAGDTLQLSVVTREPQIKFAFLMQEDTPAVATNLSRTARFITALLGETEKLPLTSIARIGAPLLAGVPGDNTETAAALHNALAQSGMFYEAHQAEWIAGERAFATLMLEPQARFAPLRMVNASASPAHAEDAEQADDADAMPRLPELPVHRDALTIIKQQLDTLETRHIAWSGVIWHGQPLDWKVAEEPPDAAEITAEQRWRTRLRLTLPRLGKIDATLLVAARGVAITLHAASAETAAALANQRAKLQQSLVAAGVAPLGITVRRDESA